VAVLQTPFLYFHGDVYTKNLGPERSRWLYPARTLLGCVGSPGSSDGPVVPDCRPLLGIQAAITRRSQSGLPVAAEEAISLNEALGLYTAGAAAAAHEESSKGSLEPGMLADLIVLGADPEESHRPSSTRFLWKWSLSAAISWSGTSQWLRSLT